MRALFIVLDSVGCGHAPDAAAYGDAGANTLGHLFENIPDLALPHMASLGLYDLLEKNQVAHLASAQATTMAEASQGKDTTTGHWELAGCITRQGFATFEKFPAALLDEIEKAAGIHFIGNFASSGTEILKLLGEEHVKTGKPILYTSADSVMQIAAHEESFGLEKLYALCATARKILDQHSIKIGRVIARPFLGSSAENFTRTTNRHDYSLIPPRTVWNELSEKNVAVIGVGKISDIYAGSGISESHSTISNQHGMQVIEELWQQKRQQDHIIVANLVDFDMHYGHRRDPAGYAQALREFDAWLGSFLPKIKNNELLIITADHGNDPYHHGTDHTRERVPLLTLHSPCTLYESKDFTQAADIVRKFFS